jgi:RecB family exonuclease
MINQTYIISSSLLMAKKYCKENSNFGYIPATLQGIVRELYNLPQFFFENKEPKILNQYEQDLKLCELHKELKEDNYFFEAMKIRGNRSLILKTLDELKLSFKDTNITQLKLEDENKAKSLIEIYEKYNKELINYSEILSTVIERIKQGKYDTVLKIIEIKILDKIEVRGHEHGFLKQLESKTKVYHAESGNNKTDYAQLKCFSAITKSSNIRHILKWMREEKSTSANTRLIALNYDDYAHELYKLKNEIPIYLDLGLKCLHFSFFEHFMTTLASMNKTYQEPKFFLENLQTMVRIRSIEDEQDDLYNFFYKKTLNIVTNIESAYVRYTELSIPIDPYELIASEMICLRFTPSELALDPAGITLSSLEDCYALESKNIVILGLAHANYPKKVGIDPILKESERKSIVKSTESNLTINAYQVDNMLDILLSKNSGSSLLTYESHNTETGKLIVPSSFFNKILKAKNKDIKIENVYSLCGIKEHYTADLLAQGQFLDVTYNPKLRDNINTQNEALYSTDVENMDYAVNKNYTTNLSASSLENFYKCPYRFNLKSNLKVYPANLGGVDKSFWLSASEEGTFLHQTYEDLLIPFFESNNTSYKDYLSSITDKELNTAIELALASEVDKKKKVTFKEFNSEVSEYIKKAEIEEMKENLTSFLQKERENLDEFYPFKLEHKFEYISMVDNVELLIAGTIDRIDTNGKGDFRVVDYKTGKNSFQSTKEYLFHIYNKKYKNYNVYFQHALYTKALLESEYANKIKSVEAGYYFTSDDAKWAKVYHSGSASDEKLEEILETYISEAKKGKYFKNGSQCNWCDYKPICSGTQLTRMGKVEFQQLITIKQTVEEQK